MRAPNIARLNIYNKRFETKFDSIRLSLLTNVVVVFIVHKIYSCIAMLCGLIWRFRDEMNEIHEIDKLDIFAVLLQAMIGVLLLVIAVNLNESSDCTTVSRNVLLTLACLIDIPFLPITAQV